MCEDEFLDISNTETPKNKTRIEIMAMVRSCLFRAFLITIERTDFLISSISGRSL